MRHPDQDPSPQPDPHLEPDSPAPLGAPPLAPPRRPTRWPLRPGPAAALGSFALYALLFAALAPSSGLFATTLAAAPAVLTAWSWGSRGAAASAAALLALHLGPAAIRGGQPDLASLYAAVHAAAIALVSGGGVGLLRDQNRRMARLVWESVQHGRFLQGGDEEPPSRPQIELPGRATGGGDELEEVFFHFAFRDPLTGLPNRALLFKHLSELLALRADDRRDVALLLLDLDHFKVANGYLGPAAGDQLLTEIAKRVRAASGAGALVARLGSDEFAVLLDGAGIEPAAIEAARRILRVLEVGFTVGGQRIFISASVGVALAGGRHRHPRDLVRDAELAIRQAKLTGGSGYALFDAALLEKLQDRAALERDLRVAIYRRQLHLAYQPIVGLGDGEVVGFEALVRWRHPRRGLISPEHFIPIAEETGAIVPLGSWVIDAACEHFGGWRRGPHRDRALQINVNVSPRQIDAEGLSQHIRAALSRRGLPAEHLALEITESAVAEDGQRAGQVLRELRRDRIQLCVDDFGTGYSSLAQLLRFPADTLKIDRCFVQGLARREEDAAVVRTIIRLGHDLGMSVVAEGIETLEQLRMLREMGCEKGQGYLFSRPLGPEAAGALLSAAPPWRPAFG